MTARDPLFAKYDLGETLRQQEAKVNRDAQELPAAHVLGRSFEELAAEVVERHWIAPLELDEASIEASEEDAQIDVSRDQMRVVYDRSRPLYVPGTRVSFHIPVRGELDLFKARPSTFSSVLPYADLVGSELRISVTLPAPVPPEQVRNLLNQELDRIRKYAAWVNADVEAFNARLSGIALAAVQRRRDKVVADQDLVSSLGVPVRRRDDAPKTYVVPTTRRTLDRAPSSPRSAPRRLEPVMAQEVYEQILGVAQNMVRVMEQSPRAFKGMKDEDLRHHFLVQLNGQFEGNATGETFNFEGKTDILVREKGRNLFIGECKFWGGAKKLTETLDQLLGYSSWRDTKTAVFLFNRGRELSGVLKQVSPTVAAHPNFVREVPYGGETDFRFVLTHRDDPGRELTVTVLVFEVPGA